MTDHSDIHHQHHERKKHIEALLEDTTKQVVKEKKKRVLFTVAFSFGRLALYVLVIGSLVAFAFVQKKKYVDSQYGFMFTNANGWFPTAPQKGAYFSLVTKQNNKEVTFVDILPMDKAKTASLTSQSMHRHCEKLGQGVTHQNLRFDSVVYKHMKGYKCSIEIQNPKGIGFISLQQLTLQNPNPGGYDFFVTITHPPSDEAEKQKIQTLMDGFEVITPTPTPRKKK